MIKQESVKKLKENLDIIQIISEYLPNLKKTGKNYFALCPFHSERTPSFSIAPDKGLIHCFGCGYTADIIKFVQDMEHITYIEAVEKIAKKINFSLEYIDPQQQKILKEKYDEQKFLLEVLTNVAEVYHNILLDEKVASSARTYLAMRGIKMETIKSFKIGFAPDENFLVNNYKNIKQLKDYDLATLYKAGVINFKEDKDPLKKYEHPYDYFRNRIVFPIFNLSGKVISFGGRILPDSLYKEDIPTYLNGPETVVFNKSSSLYGIFQAKDYIVKEKSVVIVEGYIDVIVLYQEGIKNVVAPLGTALTENQIKFLKRFLDPLNPVYLLLFDPDTAGKDASISSSKSIFGCGGFPQIVVLDERLDPDEYILKHGLEKFKFLITKASSVVKFVVEDYMLNNSLNDVSLIPLKEKIVLVKKLLDIIQNIQQPLVRSELIKEISQHLKIDERIIREESKNYYDLSKKTEILQKVLNGRPYSCEEELLWICIHYPDVINEIDDELFCHNEDYLEIFRLLKEAKTTQKDITFVIENVKPHLKELVIKMVYDEKDISCLEEKIKTLYNEIYRVKYIKRYKELKPIVERMLADNTKFEPQIINEFKQIVELLKLDKKSSTNSLTNH